MDCLSSGGGGIGASGEPGEGELLSAGRGSGRDHESEAAPAARVPTPGWLEQAARVRGSGSSPWLRVRALRWSACSIPASEAGQLSKGANAVDAAARVGVESVMSGLHQQAPVSAARTRCAACRPPLRSGRAARQSAARRASRPRPAAAIECSHLLHACCWPAAEQAVPAQARYARHGFASRGNRSSCPKPCLLEPVTFEDVLATSREEAGEARPERADALDSKRASPLSVTASGSSVRPEPDCSPRPRPRRRHRPWALDDRERVHVAMRIDTNHVVQLIWKHQNRPSATGWGSQPEPVPGLEPVAAVL